jgi:uncharacterized membrane protein
MVVRKEQSMAQENFVVVRFTEPSKAYEGLSVLKHLDAEDRIGVESAAVVERTATGDLRIAEGDDNVGLVGTATGSLLGMLIGVLGGPVGILLGWGGGALVGGSIDLDRDDESEEALTVLARAIPPESNALIACVEEPVVEIVDTEMGMLGGEVTRRSVIDVVAELETTHEAAAAAAREARRVVRENRKTELHADLDERVGKLKEKLHVS